MQNSLHHYPDYQEFKRLFWKMLDPEKSFYRVILVYSVAISLLSLAIPISVQMLIDTVANIGQLQAVMTIASILFLLLVIAGILYALRAWSMELFNRRLFSRLASEIALTGVLAQTGYFEQEQRTALFNRFFDIMTLKKNVPYLLSYGFSLFFQSLIGIIVVSVYHQYFLVFSICLIALLWMVWAAWGWPTINSAFKLSEAKHETAAWLQGLAINNGFYKRSSNLEYALRKTDAMIHRHLDAQEIHFNLSYKQLLSFLFVYAVASAALLSIGGFLVIQGQLTLGQLVSAELIMTAIFYGLPQMAGYLDYFFDVCAAIEELSRFDTVATQGSNIGKPTDPDVYENLTLENLQFSVGAVAVRLSLQLPTGSCTRAEAEDGYLQDGFMGLFTKKTHLQSGALLLGDREFDENDTQCLRQDFMVLERQTLLPVTIKEFLLLADPSANGSRIQFVLDVVGLNDEFARLPMGINTRLSHAGEPLQLEHALRLKLAFALLSQVKVVILGQIFDCVAGSCVERWMNALAKDKTRIIVIFTKRADLHGFTHTLELEYSNQTVVALDG